MEHVIVGAGPAGIIAAETLRRVDPGGFVTVVGDEREPPYSRMALPYYLSGRIGEEGTWLRHGKNHYGDNNVRILQDRATRVDPAVRRVYLERNGQLGFDRLLLATGSTPIRPPIEGIDLPGVYHCWTLEDGREIARRAGTGARVVLMGAGFIGCIILEALVRRRVELTVVEMDERMVPRMMDRTASGLIESWCEKHGVRVLMGTQVTGIDKVGSNLSVRLDNKEALAAELVICATGVKPCLDFLEGSGVQTDFGVLVDERLQSNQAGIYAAGDVCQGRDFSTGEYSVQAIQPTAAEHGLIAAMNMAGRQTLHRGSVNMNVLDTLGLISSSFGLWMGVEGGESAELCSPERYRYLKLQFKDERLVGAQAVGLTQHVGVLRGLIQTGVRLGKWKKRLLQDPTCIMDAYLGSTQAIGHNATVFA